MLKDSGDRRVFEGGAVRDISDGKGRCDLLPLDVISKIIESPSLEFIEEFKRSKDIIHLVNAITSFTGTTNQNIITGILEVSRQFEDGAKKYGEYNWQKGIPLHCYIDSGVRHCLKHLRGDTDERHDRAFIWNMVCAIWTCIHMPKFDDIV